jgi:hypothetical protein
MKKLLFGYLLLFSAIGLLDLMFLVAAALAQTTSHSAARIPHVVAAVQVHPRILAQITGHSVTLQFTASTGSAGCSATATPPCTIGYNIFRGTAAGAESPTPLNASPISATTYIDPITLTSTATTYFYTVEAVEIVNGVTGLPSVPSNEATASFPGQASPPTSVVATPK